MIRSFRDLEVWQKAMDLVEQTYRVTQAFPKAEVFQLTSQMRRAAVAVPSNIAEGHGRTGANEFRHFLSIAHGSLAELETQILISQRLGYLQPPTAEPLLMLAQRISMMIRALMTSLTKT